MSKPKKRVEIWLVRSNAGPKVRLDVPCDTEKVALRHKRNDDRIVHLVELRPGEVVVTREEARVLREAKRACVDPSVELRWQAPMLCKAVAALRATKGKRK